MTSLSGVMVLNIPPPPSDRVWYSFKTRPDLGLRIVPYYGGEKLGNDNTFSSRAINKIIDIVVNRYIFNIQGRKGVWSESNFKLN